jgi:hypothetical protein
MPITPNKEQFQALAAAPDSGPVVMLNLLKFKERRRLLRRERRRRVPLPRRRRGRDDRGARRQGHLGGLADQILIGDPLEDWDQVLLVQYPSRGVHRHATEPEYDKAHEHRESGRADRGRRAHAAARADPRPGAR